MATQRKPAGSSPKKPTKRPPKKPAKGGIVDAKAKTEKKTKKPKKPPKINTNLEYCKGCGICIAFCPTQTLGFENGKVKVIALEKCIRCNLCELRCPDFAISVEG
jgi:2-oxoglutarate ferredoxin oxidoreductase subunit delta